MPRIKIPTPYRTYCGGTAELETPPGFAQAALDLLIETYPDLKPHIINKRGQLRPFVNLFVNDIHIKDLQGLETKLEDVDILRIVPSIAGGCSRILFTDLDSDYTDLALSVTVNQN